MASNLETRATGTGMMFGLVTGAAAALLAGVQSEYAVVAGFGMIGGLVVGGFAGRYADKSLGHERWKYRVLAYTLFVSLLVGGWIGALTAWMVDASIGVGFLSGAAAGGVFSFLVGGTITATGRNPRPDDPSTPAP